MNDSKTNELGGKLIEGRGAVDEAALADASTSLEAMLPAK